MRKELGTRNGQRIRFRANAERYGAKTNWHGYPIPTLLFRDVVFADDGTAACDHVWFTCGAWSDGVIPGDTIEFDARIDSYRKGYQGPKAERLGLASVDWDYHLERPTKVKVMVPSLEEAPAA